MMYDVTIDKQLAFNVQLSALGQQEGEPFTLLDLGASTRYYDPIFEGGNAPDSISAYAQNASIADGDEIIRLSDWSGGGNHGFVVWSYNELTWNVGDGQNSYFDAPSNTSVMLDNGGVGAYPAIDDEFTLITVIKDTGDTGYGMAAAGTTPALLRSSSNYLDLIKATGTVRLMSPVDSNWHILVWFESPTGREVRWDGQVLETSTDPSPDFAKTFLRLWSRDNNSSNWRHSKGPWMVLPRRITGEEITNVETYLAARYGVTLAGP